MSVPFSRVFGIILKTVSKIFLIALKIKIILTHILSTQWNTVSTFLLRGEKCFWKSINLEIVASSELFRYYLTYERRIRASESRNTVERPNSGFNFISYIVDKDDMDKFEMN